MNKPKAKIFYYDIGDYLSREDKLKSIAEFGSMENLPFEEITPNEYGDWITQRNEKFETFIPLTPEKKGTGICQSIYEMYSLGCVTARDSWVYNYSNTKLVNNIRKTIDYYNNQMKQVQKKMTSEPERDSSKGNWSRDWMNAIKKGKLFSEKEELYTISTYRPFCKQNFYFDDDLNQERYKQPVLFPKKDSKNIIICVNSLGGKRGASCLILNTITDYNSQEAGAQCFPLYWYETIEPDQNSLFGDNEAQIVRHEAISDFILERAQSKYGNKVQREDIFYYVYGILHSPSYRETFSADLKKMLPRIPLVGDYEKFWAFSQAGRQLAHLHLNYEKVEAPATVKVQSLPFVKYQLASTRYEDSSTLLVADSAPSKEDSLHKDDFDYYAVEKMAFPKKGERGTILYNHYHTITNIPEKAYQYVVNGKSAIEWVMERYAITTDKKSGITNNPNDWSLEHNQPRYILDLLLSVINVSLQTVDIVNNLPQVDWDKE